MLSTFALYARERWAAELRQLLARFSCRSAVGATTVTAGSALVGLVSMGWAAGMDVGLGAYAQQLSAVDRATLAVHGSFAVAAAGGVHFTVRAGRGLWWLAPALAWCGSASMVTWGSYTLALDVWKPSLSCGALTCVTALTVIFGIGDAALMVTMASHAARASD